MTGRWLIGERLAAGSSTMCRCVGSVMWPGEWSERSARWGVTAVLGSIAWTVAARHPVTSGLVVGGGWSAAALVVSRPAVAEEASEDDGQEEEPEPNVAELDPADLADILREQIGDRRGIHLKTLRSVLAEELPGPDWTTAAVRELLADAGIRVREGVRVPGVGNAAGVHRDDIPAPLSPTADSPSPAVVVPGQGGNNNSNNTPIVERGEGGLTIIRHPEETRRYTVTSPARRTA